MEGTEMERSEWEGRPSAAPARCTQVKYEMFSTKLNYFQP